MNRTRALLMVLPVILAVNTSCATKAPLDRHDQADTFETYNRAMFKFNYQADKYVIKPVAEGYRAVTNEFTRNRVSNVLSTIKEPVSAVNHLLQGEPLQMAASLGRTVINATLGLGGMFDVAEGWGLKKQKTGFDETLAKWCVPDGPYLVLPILGPSTPRAATGLLADSAMNPVYLGTLNAPADVKDKIYYSYTTINGMAYREATLDLTNDLERNSVDYYTTMRSAYMQNRRGMSCSSKDKGETANYDFDFGYEEEDEIFDEMENQ
ncbi:MAG: VacJ family lipoprotein [Alphaproteobacteria bacterium]|nr:VacJ family lipoprotein [Alphaproteobacteria bacterium]